MSADNAKDPIRLPVIAPDDFPDIQFDEIDYHRPPRTDNMDMRWRVIVGINRDPNAVDAKDRRHR